MQTFLRALAVFVLFIMDSCQKPPNSSVAFQNVQEVDFEQILFSAKKKHKLVFVDMYATWCGPCKYMDLNVFNKPEIAQKLNKEFVNYKVDVDSFDGSRLRKKFRVDSFPTYLIINENGVVIHRLEGIFTPPVLMDEADFAIAESKKK